MGILEEIQVEANRAVGMYGTDEPEHRLSDWACIMLSYVGEAFSVRYRDIQFTRTCLIKVGGLVVNCIRQIDAGHLKTHSY